MKRLAAKLVVGVFALALMASACGDAFDSDLLASIEGRWMCDVHRYAFSDLDAMQAELDSRLKGNGVDADSYRAFKDALEERPELRASVWAEYEAYCDR